ncbi:unnamed protein product, partial [Coregonus sp. 'balchen']
MEDRKLKRKISRPSTNQAPAPPTSTRKNTAPGRHLGFSHMGTHASQKGKSRRGVKARQQQASGSKSGQGQPDPIQHSFLTDVSDVQEMEKGLLSLLNDFHNGKLQAFGNECSIDQMEHVREMQEKLARLHFDLYGESEAESGRQPGDTQDSQHLSRSAVNGLSSDLSQSAVNGLSSDLSRSAVNGLSSDLSRST